MMKTNNLPQRLFSACVFCASILTTLFFSVIARADLAEHRKAAQDIQDSLNKTAQSPSGYFSIQDMVVLKSGEAAVLIVNKNPLETKWEKLKGEVRRNPENYYVDYNGKEAFLAAPNLQPVDLLKLEDRNQTLANGLIVRVSFLKKVDLKVWLHNPAMANYQNFKAIEFFPFSEKGIVKATFIKKAKAEKVEFKDSRDENGTMYVMGVVKFKLGGKNYSFKAYSYEETWETMKHMMFFIKDLTTGKTTYGGGRVVEFDTPKEFKENNIEVNFNRAYAFLCAHSKFYNCPLVLTDKIQSKLEYGEKTSSTKH